MNKNVQETDEPTSKLQKLILTDDEPIGEIQDFLNCSLSDGYYSIQGCSKVNTNNHLATLSSQERQKETLKRVQFESCLNSPTSQFLVNPSARSPIQSSNHQPNYSFNQFCLMTRFINRVSWKKKINSQFSFYQYNIIKDLGSSFDLKLFKDSSLNLKPMVSRFQSKEISALQQRQKQLKEKLKKKLTDVKKFGLDLYKKLDVLIEKIPLISPESRWKIVWDCVGTISRLYFLFIIPIDLAWNNEKVIFGILYTPTIFMLMILLFDFLISFNNSFYQFGQIVNGRMTIAKHVISKSYGTEAISLIILVIFTIMSKSYNFNLMEDWYDLLMLLFYVQCKNIPKLISQIEEVLNLSKPSSSLLELVKLLLVLFFVLHCYSCLWYFVGYYSSIYSERGSWLETYHLENETWNVQYLYSFYYSTVTMFTIGYGDIVPISYLERIIAVLYMMVSSIQLSYSVNTVGAIIETISAYGQEKMRKMRKINNYMQNRKIEYQLQYQIREYLNYYWESENQVENEELNSIINQLSENLREKLMNQSNQIMLNECPLFKKHFSEPLKQKLVHKIKTSIIQPENIIDFDSLFPQLPIGQIFVCFVEFGEIQIFIQNDSIDQLMDSPQIAEVSTVGKGSSLGIISFINGKQSQERFRSVGFSKLLLLSRDDFLKVIQDFPEDYERFRDLYDSLVFDDISALQMKCFSCNLSNHRVLQCPLLHYIPDRELIIKRYNYSKDQERKQFVRNPYRQRGFFAALYDQDIIEQEAQNFDNNNWKYVEFYEEPDDEFLKKSDISQTQIINQNNLFETGHLNNPNSTIPSQQIISNQQILPISDPSPKLNVEPPPIVPQKKKATLFKQRTKTIELLDIDDKQLKASLMSKARNSLFNNNLMIIREEDQSDNSPKNSQNKFKIRPSITLEFNPERAKKNLRKFKNLVKMTIQMNRMKKKQKLKRDAKSLYTQFIDIMQSQLFMRGLLGKIKIRIKQIENGKKTILNEQDIINTYLLEIKLQMEINRLNEFQKQESQLVLESYKRYKFYQIQNNLDKVLEKQYFYKQQLLLNPSITEQANRLLKYMIYPQVFFERCRYQPITLPKFEDVLEKKEEPIIDNESILRRSKMIKKSFRNAKLAQVRPMSDGQGTYRHHYK